MRKQIEIAIRAVQAAKNQDEASPDYPKLGKIEDVELIADLVIKRLEELRKDVPST